MSFATAQAVHPAAHSLGRPPKILVFDSGLGGLTVFAEIVKLRPMSDYLYAGDDAVFPYGRLSEADVVARVMEVMERLVSLHRPDIVVIACATASTLVLPPLRRRWPAIPFVGTVPAIKPAAAASQSRIFSVLATPGTVAREYTRDLIRSFAQECAVTLVGAKGLAVLAEAAMRGEPVPDAAILDEIAPAFVEAEGRRTDTIVLACTHYPLLLDTLERLSPWRVTFIDPAPAIARRVDALLTAYGMPTPGAAIPGAEDAPVPPRAALFTSVAEPAPALRAALRARGLADLRTF